MGNISKLDRAEVPKSKGIQSFEKGVIIKVHRINLLLSAEIIAALIIIITFGWIIINRTMGQIIRHSLEYAAVHRSLPILNHSIRPIAIHKVAFSSTKSPDCCSVGLSTGTVIYIRFITLSQAQTILLRLI